MRWAHTHTQKRCSKIFNRIEKNNNMATLVSIDIVSIIKFRPNNDVVTTTTTTAHKIGQRMSQLRLQQHTQYQPKSIQFSFVSVCLCVDNWMETQTEWMELEGIIFWERAPAHTIDKGRKPFEMEKISDRGKEIKLALTLLALHNRHSYVAICPYKCAHTIRFSWNWIIVSCLKALQR